MRRKMVIFLLAGACVITAGCSHNSEDTASKFPPGFSHPEGVSSQQRANAMQAQADYFKKKHPERFVNGQITGPGGAPPGAPENAIPK